jgi:hypothetical protein
VEIPAESRSCCSNGVAAAAAATSAAATGAVVEVAVAVETQTTTRLAKRHKSLCAGSLECGVFQTAAQSVNNGSLMFRRFVTRRVHNKISTSDNNNNPNNNSGK